MGPPPFTCFVLKNSASMIRLKQGKRCVFLPKFIYRFSAKVCVPQYIRLLARLRGSLVIYVGNETVEYARKAGTRAYEAIDLVGESESVSVTNREKGGEEVLKAHPEPGARPRLTAEQQAQIPAVLPKGAAADGCGGEVWNSRRRAMAIKRECGVSSHLDHCGNVVRKMGDSTQKPVTRVAQRNEQAITYWNTHHWPRLQKKARQEQRMRLVVDEAGFSLLPMVVRTSARREPTPLLRVPLTGDPLSAIRESPRPGGCPCRC